MNFRFLNEFLMSFVSLQDFFSPPSSILLRFIYQLRSKNEKMLGFVFQEGFLPSNIFMCYH